MARVDLVDARRFCADISVCAVLLAPVHHLSCFLDLGTEGFQELGFLKVLKSISLETNPGKPFSQK